MFLNAPTRSKFVEVTLCDFGKNNVKGVHHAQEVISYEINSEFKELTTEKKVRQINLHAEVEKV